MAEVESVSQPATRPINLTRLMDMHARGEKISALSVQDATFASAAASAGVECILIDEALVRSYQGKSSHDDITLHALAYHVGNVSRGLRRTQASAWVMSDLPAHTYGGSNEAAMHHASRLFMEGAQMLRMKMDENFLSVASFLTERGIPVCGHLTGMERSVRTTAVNWMARSGAKFLVLERMGDAEVLEIAKDLPQCVTLGIHSGQETSGQLLSLISLLGVLGQERMHPGETYLSKSASVKGALLAFVADVKANTPVLG